MHCRCWVPLVRAGLLALCFSVLLLFKVVISCPVRCHLDCLIEAAVSVLTLSNPCQRQGVLAHTTHSASLAVQQTLPGLELTLAVLQVTTFAMFLCSVWTTSRSWTGCVAVGVVLACCGVDVLCSLTGSDSQRRLCTVCCAVQRPWFITGRGHFACMHAGLARVCWCAVGAPCFCVLCAEQLVYVGRWLLLLWLCRACVCISLCLVSAVAAASVIRAGLLCRGALHICFSCVCAESDLRDSLCGLQPLHGSVFRVNGALVGFLPCSLPRVLFPSTSKVG